MSRFVPGITLCKAFYAHAVKPLLEDEWPKLPYSVGLVGWGSDALGYDTPRSMDHMWGPRLQLFLNDADHAQYAESISQHLRHKLPLTFQGFSAHFGAADAVGVRRAEEGTDGAIEHMVEVFTPRSFLKRYLKVSPDQTIRPVDWLDFSEQSLLEMTSGKVFHDGLGVMHSLRERFAYYPDDAWLHKLAKTWQELTDEEAFPGRCNELGDDVGCRLIVARQVQRLMQLCFLIERRYAPYSKWFGTAFDSLRAARTLKPLLKEALSGRAWSWRERHLAKAYEFVARAHNKLGITDTVPAKVTDFFGRPYKVIWGDAFAKAAADRIRDPEIRKKTSVRSH